MRSGDSAYSGVPGTDGRLNGLGKSIALVRRLDGVNSYDVCWTLDYNWDFACDLLAAFGKQS